MRLAYHRQNIITPWVDINIHSVRTSSIPLDRKNMLERCRAQTWRFTDPYI